MAQQLGALKLPQRHGRACPGRSDVPGVAAAPVLVGGIKVYSWSLDLDQWRSGIARLSARYPLLDGSCGNHRRHTAMRQNPGREHEHAAR